MSEAEKRFRDDLKQHIYKMVGSWFLGKDMNITVRNYEQKLEGEETSDKPNAATVSFDKMELADMLYLSALKQVPWLEKKEAEEDELDTELIKKYLTALELKPHIKYLLVVSKDAMRHSDVIQTLGIMKDIGVADSAAVIVNGSADQVKLIELPNHADK